MSPPQAQLLDSSPPAGLATRLARLGRSPRTRRDARRGESLGVCRRPHSPGDGTERRRQRPKDDAQQKEHYSGKKQAPTDKNILVVNANTKQVVYVSPTVPGKTHDKKAK